MVDPTPKVTVDQVESRTTVEWSRPPVNVFDIALLRELGSALRSEAVLSANVVVLRGANHRWSAGFAVEDHLTDRLPLMLAAFREVLRALADVPGPTLAQVEGPCLGGGLEIVLGCDLAWAAASATFGQPEVRLGVFPPLSAAVAPPSLGPKRAAELLLLGETLTASRAEAIGLISRVVPDEAIESEVTRTTDRLRGLRRETLVLLKRAMSEDAATRWRRFDHAERIYLDELTQLPQADEGLRAFLEKRAPVWPRLPR